ncbi:butyrate kinase [Symbiobacterium thermophilum]|uniref:Probable butyrate kinase n=1 Tax=Symbiobacterium thermophilum (strain DSM 24528 / JCM 14929 / IAM 14863 / T) TaxID=292459 RepID=Q67ND2_SYMTH|nr:butyrate kinase [Symbiobacterium thermophilum]BAD40811.1 branched-chain-fatty-acid kinase [Symbiobacterium thermophilum IAM 14863]
MQQRLLIINPGSTSTKIAVYDDDSPLFAETLRHSAADLACFRDVAAQFPFRRDLILEALDAHGVSLSSLTAVVGRGGLLRPVRGGTYRVDAAMLAELSRAAHGEHASNLGALLAHEIAQAAGGVPAFIVDPVVVDELEPVARLTGLPEMPRRSVFHALNQKAVARRAAADLGRAYTEVNLVVVHLGGGISVGAHRRGRVVDVNNALDGEGPMAPERAGTVPSLGLVHLAFSWQHTLREVGRMLVGRGGLVAHVGTNDARRVEERIAAGDEAARVAYRAMAYQVAKEVGRAAVALGGQVDRIVLTGGLAHSEMLTGWIAEQVEWIAPVAVYPGEDEMAALAAGALRVLRGEEPAQVYGEAGE